MIEIIFYIFQGKKPRNWGGRKDRDKEIRKGGRKKRKLKEEERRKQMHINATQK